MKYAEPRSAPKMACFGTQVRDPAYRATKHLFADTASLSSHLPYTTTHIWCTNTGSGHLPYTMKTLWCTADDSDLFLSADKSF